MLQIAAALALGIFLFCAVVLLFGRGAEEQDQVRTRLFRLGRELNRAYLIADEDLSKPLSERLVKPAMRKLSRFLRSILPVQKRKGNGNEKQKRLLEQAGWTISVEEYMVLQFMAMVGCGILGAALGFFLEVDLTHILLYFFVGAFTAYAILRYFCAARATARRTAIEKQLPDMMDLLSVSITAGLGFERALLHIIESMDGPLIDELSVTYREMSMGLPRQEALTLLGDRCGVEELSSFTGALVQAGQLGIPISNILQAQSAAIRRSRRSKVQEKAAKVSTKILFPMVVFIFPVLFVVLLGPSVITIMEQFG